MSESSEIPQLGSREPATSGPIPPNNVDWSKLDALLKDLPPGIPLLPPEDADNFENYTHRPPHAYAPGEGWKNCARALERHDAELCKGYREEIDTLLVFAGLFSAVVTAFTIESYQWLQADPNDAIIALLSQISRSVSHNNTAASLVSASTGLPGSVSVRINVYWFLALALSLTTSLVAILCKQWVREFERNPGLTPEHFVGIHQTKLEGLEKWQVGGIISLLPLLLQLALAIFALGLLELLWQLHTVIAAIVCVPTGAALILYTATTVIPALQHPYFRRTRGLSFWDAVSECPYKSPQAKLFFPLYELYLWTKNTIAAGLSYIAYLLSLSHYHVARLAQRNMRHPIFTGEFERLTLLFPAWHRMSLRINVMEQMDKRRPPSIYRSLRFIDTNLNDGDVTGSIWHCLWEKAVLSDPRFTYIDENVERGFAYVTWGSTDTPSSGLRALALTYLLRTRAPRSFLAEACIQNLNSMDNPDSAGYLIHHLSSEMQSGIGPEVAVTLLRAVSAYGRVHIHEQIGYFLVHVARISCCITDLELRGVFIGCTQMLYHTWLHLQPIPSQPATVEMSGNMIWYHCVFLSNALVLNRAERLRLRPGVQELAELVHTYAQSHGDPAATLSAKISPAYEETIRPVIRELLNIARHGLGQDRAITPSAAANDGVLDAPSPALPTVSSVAHSPTRPVQEELYPLIFCQEASGSHNGHGSALGDSVGSRGASSETPDSQTLHFVLDHAPAHTDARKDVVRPEGASGQLSPQTLLHVDAVYAPPGAETHVLPGNNLTAAVNGEGDRHHASPNVWLLEDAENAGDRTLGPAVLHTSSSTPPDNHDGVPRRLHDGAREISTGGYDGWTELRSEAADVVLARTEEASATGGSGRDDGPTQHVVVIHPLPRPTRLGDNGDGAVSHTDVERQAAPGHDGVIEMSVVESSGRSGAGGDAEFGSSDDRV